MTNDDKARGLFPKYKVTRADGHPADDGYFILRDSDPHAEAIRGALKTTEGGR